MAVLCSYQLLLQEEIQWYQDRSADIPLLMHAFDSGMLAPVA
jgi:hypothetical protein